MPQVEAHEKTRGRARRPQGRAEGAQPGRMEGRMGAYRKLCEWMGADMPTGWVLALTKTFRGYKAQNGQDQVNRTYFPRVLGS